MVRVVLIDSATVVVDGKTIAGPAVFDASEAIASSTTYTQGSIVVSPSGVAVSSTVHPFHQLAMPYAVLLIFVLGTAMGLKVARE